MPPRALLALCLLALGCGGSEPAAHDTTDGSLPEASAADGSIPDVTSADGSISDAAVVDASEIDADLADGAPPDAAHRLWHLGTFRYLPSISGDLVDFVGDLEHPNAGGYGKLSANRRQAFEKLVVALFSAIDASLLDGDSADWCGVQALADDAGYELFRFYETREERWLVYGRDRTSYGQAYFFINPAAKRDLVIEAPHAPYDVGTDVQAARVFLGTAARVMILNKEHRCSDPDPPACAPGSGPCSGTYRESDVAHETENAFHVLHLFLSDGSGRTKFAQLHGMVGAADDVAEVSDGSKKDMDLGSVSVACVDHLRKYVPDADTLFSCQGFEGWPPAQLCGSTNVQGRATNSPDADECTTPAQTGNGRFLHIEQRGTLRDNDDSDGYFWGDVRDALIDTFPDCNMGSSATDCSLGAAQSQPSNCTCGEACP